MTAGNYHLMQAKALLGAVAVELEQLSGFVDVPPPPKPPGHWGLDCVPVEGADRFDHR